MLKRKLKSLGNSLKKLLKLGKKSLVCKECDIESVEVAQDISAVTCAYCVQKQVLPPTPPKNPNDKFPRGWALKSRYVHTDGRVFEKGKEVIPSQETISKKVIKKNSKKIGSVEKNKKSSTKKK